MADIDPIVVKISTELEPVKKDLAQLKKHLGDTGKSAKKAGDQSLESFSKMSDAMANAAKKAAALAAAYLSVKAATDTYLGTISRAREIDQFSKRVGVSRDRFAQLDVMVRSVGGTTEDLFDVFKDLNVRITDAANGAKSYDDELVRIGLNSRLLKRMSPEKQFLAFADALSKADESAARFAIDELVSDPGIRMIEVLRKGSKEINKMGEELAQTNQALSETDFKQLEEAAKAQRELTMAFEKFANILVVKVAPHITSVMKELTDAIDPPKKSIKELQGELEGLYARMNKRAADNSFIGSFFKKKDLDKMQADIEAKVKEIAERVKSMQESGELSVSPIVGAAQAEEGGDDVATDMHAEAIAESYRRAAELYEQIEQQKILVKAESLAQEAIMQREFEDAEFGAAQRQAERMQRLWKAGYKGRQRIASEFFGQISTLMDTNSRKQFEIGKAAAIAQVAIDTPKAAMSAYSAMAGIPYIGPVLGAIAAASAIATGVSQIQNIKSQSFGGGNVAGGGVDAGGGAAAGAAGGGGEAPANVIDATFNLSTSQGFVSTDQIRSVAQGLNEYIQDGGQLRSVKVI